MEKYAGIPRSIIARIGPAFAPKDPRAKKDFLRAVKKAYKGKLPPIFDSLAEQVQRDIQSGRVRGDTLTEKLQDALSGAFRRLKDPELVMPLVYTAAAIILPGGDDQLTNPQVQEGITEAVKWLKNRFL